MTAALDARITSTNTARTAFDEQLSAQRDATTATLGDLDTGLGDIGQDGCEQVRVSIDQIQSRFIGLTP